MIVLEITLTTFASARTPVLAYEYSCSASDLNAAGAADELCTSQGGI